MESVHGFPTEHFSLITLTTDKMDSPPLNRKRYNSRFKTEWLKEFDFFTKSDREDFCRLLCQNANVYVPDYTRIWTVRVRSGSYVFFFKILIRLDRMRTVCLVVRDYRGFKIFYKSSFFESKRYFKKVNYRNCTI